MLHKLDVFPGVTVFIKQLLTPLWIMESIWCPSIVTIDESEDFCQSFYVLLVTTENSSCCKCSNVAKELLGKHTYAHTQTHTNTFIVYGYFVLCVLLNNSN